MSKKAKPAKPVSKKGVQRVRKENKNTRVGKKSTSSSPTTDTSPVSSVGELEQVAEALRGKKRGKRSGGEPGGGLQRILPSSSNPMPVARQFLRESGLETNGEPTIRHWRSGWWFWLGSCWVERDDHTIRAMLYKFTEHAVVVTPLDIEPWMPNRRKITDLADALRAIAVLPADVDQPSWLDGRSSGKIIVATANGLLDIERGQLYPHSPLYFNSTAVPFDYQPEASEPKQWLEFLDRLWPKTNADDKVRPEIDALGEWFGYVASGRLDLHKAMLMVGPTRGGKGIIARILGALIGEANVAGPSLSSLGGEFGLAPLLGKSLAVLSDTRAGKHNSAVVVERLLSISGEDTLTVNRKFKDQWTGKLPCRLHIVSNELPKLDDASSAIVGRLVILLLTNSWLGNEDHDLENKLRIELPGILNWALEGLKRLALTNRFTPIKEADEAIRQMRDLASPVRAFVRENCQLDSQYFIDVDHLFVDFKNWAENNGHPKSTKQMFGRDLRAAFPSFTMQRLNTETGEGPERKTIRHRVYNGIRLRPIGDEEAD